MKKPFFLFVALYFTSLFYSANLFAQGGVDCPTAFANQITLPYNGTVLSNCGADNFTSFNTAMCVSYTYIEGDDKLYAFTPTSSGLISIELNSAYNNSSLFLYDNCPLSSVCLASNVTTLTSKRLAYYVNSGTTYYIMVSSTLTPSSCLMNYSLSVSPPQIGGLDCVGAATHQLTLPFFQAGLTNCGANNFGPGSVITCGATGTYLVGDDRVYAFTPTETGTTTISVASSNGGLGLFLYDGCPTGGACVGSAVGVGTSQSIPATLIQNKTYFLVVSSNSTTACHAIYSLSIPLPVPPGGVTCVAALANKVTLPFNLSGLSNCGSNNITTVNIAKCTPVGGTAYNYVAGEDRIYAFTVPAGVTNITVNFSSNSQRVGLFLHNNCPTMAGSCVKAQYGVSGNQSFAAVVTPGGTYYLVVSSWPNALPPTYQCHSNYALSIIPSVAGVPNTQDCMGAIDICQSLTEQGQYYAGTGNVPNEINSGVSCLGSGEKNDVWYRFTALTSGQLKFTITPNTMSDDYDWAVYDLTNASCADIATNAALEISCNYSGVSGLTGANGSGGAQNEPPINVVAGGTYVLNVSQYTASTAGFTLNTGASTAQIFDNSPPIITSVTGPFGCGVSSIKVNFSEPVRCYSLKTSDYSINGPGGPYIITTIGNPASCTAADSKALFANVTFSPPATLPGSYTIDIKAGSFSDKCGNINVTSFTYSFVVTPVTATVTTLSSITCYKADNGVVRAYPSGGVAPYSYVWNSTPARVTQTVSGMKPGTYTLTVSTPAGCIVTKTITLAEPDSVPAPIVEKPFYNFCLNALATNLSATGQNLEWTLPLGGTNIITFTSISPTPFTSATGVLSYNVTQTIDGCKSVATYTRVYINEFDRPYFTYGSDSYCLTGANPAAIFASNTTFPGIFSSSPSGLSITNSATGAIDLPSSVPGTYLITYSTSGICPDDSVRSLTITEPRNPTFTYPIDYFCPGGVATTRIFPTVVDIGVFSVNPGGLKFVSSATGEIDLEASNGSVVPYVITNTIAPENGCAQEKHSFNLLVKELPKVDFTTEKMADCDPFTAKFAAKVEEVGDYFWTFGDDDSSTVANPEHLYKLPGDYKVKLVFGKPGCSDKIEKTVTSYELPIAKFTTYPEPGVVGSPQNFTDESLKASKWLWFFGDNETATEQTPTHVYAKSGVYEIFQVAFTEHNCMDTVSYKIVVENSIAVFFPQSFSPNGDGLNDFYEVKVSGINPDAATNFELSIFDRWGNRRYYSTDYANHKWDGGGDTSSNVYVMKLKVQDKEGSLYNYKGTITILK